MYKMHDELNEFYEQYVRLKDEKKKLEAHRDVNIERLHDGLEMLEFPCKFDAKDQGSYAMNTINKHPEKKYDIDEAIIFEKADLPDDPADVRKRIESAMIKAGGNFSEPPEAKTNAVRVYYAEGHHIDLAIYRKYTNTLGNSVIEHAGPVWTIRDPEVITKWFLEAVATKSPSKKMGSEVNDGQLRRVVRWLKMFAKSRPSWENEMPGGLILSVLAVEQYISDYNRDDVALYQTMNAIRNRLRISREVRNPVYFDQLLTCREKDKVRVRNLEENLDFVLKKMNDLFDTECDDLKALKAWQWVFKHSFWDDKLGEALKKSLQDGSLSTSAAGSLLGRNGERTIPVPVTRFFGGE